MTDARAALLQIAADDREWHSRQKRIAELEHAGHIQELDKDCPKCRELAALSAMPRDLGSRLVFADWLNDRGDAWAELIRVSCELAEIVEPHVCGFNHGAGACFVCRLRAQAAKLLADNRRELTMRGFSEKLFFGTKGICNGFCGGREERHFTIDFDLGIPAILRIRSEELLQHGRTLIEAHPALTQVEITSNDDFIRWGMHNGLWTIFRGNGSGDIPEQIFRHLKLGTKLYQTNFGGTLCNYQSLDQARQDLRNAFDAEFRTASGQPQFAVWRMPATASVSTISQDERRAMQRQFLFPERDFRSPDAVIDHMIRMGPRVARIPTGRLSRQDMHAELDRERGEWVCTVIYTTEPDVAGDYQAHNG